MKESVPQDPIDRSIYIAYSGQPHNPAIAHLSVTHSLPSTAGYILDTIVNGQKDPDTACLLAALRKYTDTDSNSPTFGCYKWFVEDPAINDTNASFFICSSLTGLWLAHRADLNTEEESELKGVFSDVLPWFQRMSEAPSFFYPNKCLSDAAMLLSTGHILDDASILESGRDFCHRYFDYYIRRGTGWGEDHSPVYTTVIIEMTLLIMALERSGTLFEKAKQMTDTILEWVAFHDGFDAVPSIRGYNFDCNIEVNYRVRSLIEGQASFDAPSLLSVFQRTFGYRYQPSSLNTPRQRRWRTFDEHFSTSFIDEKARLGTLSYYPLMPNGYMHDEWGLGWQSKPCSFIAGQEYGVLEWMTEDDEGIVRQHEANGTIQDWPSRHLFKRLSFHPDVVFIGHQEGKAAIVLRELHQVHSPTRRIVDRWRLAHSAGSVLINNQEWNGKRIEISPQWIVLKCSKSFVALRPLKCRVLDEARDDRNPQRRTTGVIMDLPVIIEKNNRGVFISLPLVTDHSGTIAQRLFFSGWCIVLLDSPDDVTKLTVKEAFHEDGEIPRTYGELIRSVELTTSEVKLNLVRDMLTGEVQRFINGESFSFR